MEIDGNMLMGLLALLVAGPLAWIVRNLIGDMKALQKEISDLQKNLPKEYVLASTYREDLREVKGTLDKIYRILDKKANRSEVGDDTEH